MKFWLFEYLRLSQKGHNSVFHPLWFNDLYLTTKSTKCNTKGPFETASWLVVRNRPGNKGCLCC